MNHIHALEDTRQFTVIDEKDVVHFLHNEDIVYAAAEGRNCRIYTVDGSEICGRLNMTEFQQICGKELVPVHRSYVINRNYISLIQRYEVVMLDGSKIPDSGKEIQGDEGLSDRDAWCKKRKMIIRSS